MNVTADRLKQLRDKLNFSQKSLETFAGLKQRTLSQWESGNTPDSFGWLGKLAQRYEVSTDYLLGLTDDPTPAGEVSEIQQLFDMLSPEAQKHALESVRGILEGESEEYRIERLGELLDLAQGYPDILRKMSDDLDRMLSEEIDSDKEDE